MENQNRTDFDERLKRLEELEEKRLSYAKKQFYMTAVAALSCVLVFCAVAAACFSVIPRVHKAFDDIGRVTSDMEMVSRQLSEADLSGLVEKIDRIAVTSEKGVREALMKIAAIDIEQLNRAIQSLSEIIAPMARFAGRFQ